MTGADGDASFNATEFAYGDLPSAPLSEYAVTIENDDDFDVFTGDFDGNGMTDLVIAEVDWDEGMRFHERIHVHLNGSLDSDFEYDPPGTALLQVNYEDNYCLTAGVFTGYASDPNGTTSSHTIEPNRGFNFTDLNGDGRDDILIANVEFDYGADVSAGNSGDWWGAGLNGAWSLLSIDVLISDCVLSGANFSSPVNHPAPSAQRYFQQPGRFMQLGDFSADGKTDAVVIFNDLSSGPVAYAWLFTEAGWASVDISANGSMFSSVDRIVTGDCDGDGVSDLLMFKDGGSYREYNAVGIDANNESYLKRYDGSFNWTYDDDLFDLKPGDFNGDGITDHFVRRPDGNDEGEDDDWWILTGTLPESQWGTDFVSALFDLQAPYDDNDQILIADFDGNGMSDIAHYYSDEGWRLRVHFAYGHNGSIPLFQSPVELLTDGYHSDLDVGDYDGDGKLDILGSNDVNSNVAIIRANGGTYERLLHVVSDGFCSRTSFQYQSMVTGVYLHTPTDEYPLNNIGGSLPLLKYVNVPNGDNGVNTTGYIYLDGRLHRGGRGFLGFERILTGNSELDRRTDTRTEFASPYYVPSVTQHILSRMPLTTELSTTEYDFAFQGLGAPALKRYYTKLLHTTTTDHITGSTTLASNTWDGFGNVISTEQNVNDGLLKTTTINSYSDPGPSAYPFRLTSSWVTSTRQGEDPVSKNSTYGYDPVTGALTAATEFVGLPKAVTTLYDLNAFGCVVHTETYHAGLEAQDHRRVEHEYDAYSRYPVKSTSMWNNSGTDVPVVTETGYDAKWGLPLNSLSSDGLTTLLEYDAFGRLTRTYIPHQAGTTRGAVESVLTWEIDQGTGQFYLRTVSAPGKPIVEEGIDALGRVLRKRVQVNTASEWSESTFAFDNRGRLIHEVQGHIAGEDHFTVDHQYLHPLGLRTLSYHSVAGSTEYEYEFDGEGNTTTTITTPSNQVSTSTVDATGLTTSATDDGGKLVYRYYSDGSPRSVKLNDELVAFMQYDEYGRQKRLLEPNSGTTRYEYDAFGQLVHQYDAMDNLTTYEYDNLGRQVKRVEPEGTTTWAYFQNGALVNNNVVSEIGLDAEFHYEYDDPYFRLSKATTIVDGTAHESSFQYNDQDQVTSRQFPSGVQLDYSYTNQGNLGAVKWNDVFLFRAGTLNGQGQYLNYAMGVLPQTEIEYDHNLPVRYHTDQVQDLRMDWDLENGTGNFLDRWDHMKDRREYFEYDALDRVTKSNVVKVDGQGNTTTLIAETLFAYDGDIGHTKGNLATKDDVGLFSYGANRITGAVNVSYPTPPNLPPDVISLETQLITYTSYHQPYTLNEKVGSTEYDLTYHYGPDHQRCKSVLEANSQVQETRYYLGDYEKQIDQNGTRELHYVAGGDGLCAILVTEGGTTSVYHVFKDHLGSILTLVRSDGMIWGITAERSFDAWGRPRNADDWTYENVGSSPSWLYRGYTGHEHVEPFALVNMNGRMYDPVNGRMLSVDNVLHAGTQGFNRYSYAFNNPLMYADADGEHPLIVIGIMALAGAYAGGAIAAGDGGLSGANWNPFDWGGTDWYKGAAIGLGLGAAAGWGITALGPFAANALYSAGLTGATGAKGVAASALGYGIVGAIAGGAAGFGTGYLTDRYVNEVPHEEAVNTGWSLSKYGAALGATVGMAYGLTPGGFNRIRPICQAAECSPNKYGGFPNKYLWSNGGIRSVRGVGTKWVDQTLWSTTNAAGTPIVGTPFLQYALPTAPWWIGQPGYRGPTLWQSGRVPNFNLSFFLPGGGNPVANWLGDFNFPWGGTYVNNWGINIGLVYRQRIRFRRSGWSFFGLFTIWR